MPYSITIEGRVAHVHWFGALCRRDLDTLGQDLPRVGRQLGFAPHVLHTFGEVKAGLPPIEAFTYALRPGQAPIPNPVRAAIVADSDTAEALATVFRLLNATPNLEMAVFKNEAEARGWLAGS